MKGILFKPDMIRAIVDGSKTQTRRSAGLEEVNQAPDDWEYNGWAGSWQGFAFSNLPSATTSRICRPRYLPNEVVYIKEAYWQDQSGGLWDYKLDSSRWENIEWPVTICGGKAISPLFMPAWAARYFIRITDVRAERVQEITEEDAFAEGCKNKVLFSNSSFDIVIQPASDVFRELWNSINKPPFDREVNPWVWVISFKVV